MDKKSGDTVLPEGQMDDATEFHDKHLLDQKCQSAVLFEKPEDNLSQQGSSYVIH